MWNQTDAGLTKDRKTDIQNKHTALDIETNEKAKIPWWKM